MMDNLLNSQLLFNLAGGLIFTIYDASEWQWQHYVVWTILILLALQILAVLVLSIGKVLGLDDPKQAIKIRGKHLDVLEPIDQVYISINKLLTALFTYQAINYVWFEPLIKWHFSELTLSNSVQALVLLYLVYDFNYTLFHRALHHKSIYAFIHKHHHRQMAPTRGNIDAINVHPFEFIVGEYNHLFSVWFVSTFLLKSLGGVHIYVITWFVIGGGILASLNHTRFDIRVPLPFMPIDLYSVKVHDTHHWYPPCNYGQYTMIWDYLMSSYKPYPSTKEE
jgi:sterol desaturase/sphingolipid hydroxylase (fatty acid hydroxylase superfamily)